MKKISRNDPCHCGSGKKYKQCCQRHEEAQAAKAHTMDASISGAIQAALEHHQAGRLQQAEAIFQQILQAAPNHPDALHFSGVIAYQCGKKEAAAELISKAIHINPSSLMYYNLGLVLRAQGKQDEAIESYCKALLLKPDYAEAHNNLGNVLKDQGRLEEAIQHYRKALSIKPDDAGAHNNLGSVLKGQGMLEEAIQHYRKALLLKPGYVEAHNNLGNALRDQGKLDEAAQHYRKALVLKPDLAEAHNNLGNVLRGQGKLDEAIQHYRNALLLKPDYVEAYNNLGNVFLIQGKWDTAIESFRKALLIKPDYADVQFNLGLAFLTLGQYQLGWQGYEMRWEMEGAKRFPEMPYPCWLGGEDIAGKKLLIQVEQGLGDAIQMMRYIPLLEQENVECWIQVPNSLHRLIARSFPRAKVVGQHVCPDGLDYRIPVMSLPLAMQTFSEPSIPRYVPYLVPDDDRVGYWQKQLTSVRSKTVGLVWHGNPKQSNDYYRSASLKDLLPLVAAYESIQFVTLQKNLTDAERNALKEYSNTRMLDDELTDLDETAAVMCNMDIVISVCTGPAHLSGALGKSTWILLSLGADWRWMAGRTDSPWYPSAKLFRQKSVGNWAEVVNNIKTSLDEYLRQG